MKREQRTWKQFEDIVRKILELNGFDIDSHFPQGDEGFDFAGSRNNQKWAIEVKFYRTTRPQPALIESAANRVANNGAEWGATRGMLVTSCVLSNALRSALLEKFSITLIDCVDLRNWAAVDPPLAQSLEALIATTATLELGALVERTKVSLDERPISAALRREKDTRGKTLCAELKEIERGFKNWPLYESHCEKILRYLFPDDLSGWHSQRRTDDGLTRFDFVCRVRPTTEFWQFLIGHLNSRYIVFEFKNYSGRIKQGQILTTEKYLLERGLRRVAIVFTRAGADRNAVRMTQGAMRENGKLILVVTDEDLCQMLHMKQRGEDPTDALFDLADDFLMTLPR